MGNPISMLQPQLFGPVIDENQMQSQPQEQQTHQQQPPQGELTDVGEEFLLREATDG